MMTWLRILLVLSLLVGGLLISFHIPYKATAVLNEMSYTTALSEEVPFYEAPPKARLAQFKGKLSEFLDETSVQFMVEKDWNKILIRCAIFLTGALLIYGLLGLALDKSKPKGMDVAYCLALSLGILLGTAASSVYGSIKGTTDLPWLNYFWTAGVVLSLMVTLGLRRKAGEPF